MPFKNPKAKTSPKISATQMEHQTSQVPTAGISCDSNQDPPISELRVCHWTRIKVRDLNLNLRRLRTFPWRIKSVEMVVTHHVRSLVWTNHRVQEEGLS